jgi:hypothetical protein
VLGDPTFKRWRESDHDDLLWSSAGPGCGKSVLSRVLIDEDLLGADNAFKGYFFFKDNTEADPEGGNTFFVLDALDKC